MSDDLDISIDVKFDKANTNDDLRLVGGFGFVAKQNGEALYDTQGDTIDPGNLREALHEFMKGDRSMGVMHIEADGTVIKAGEIVEAAVLGDGFSPPGWNDDDVAVWLVAKVADDDIWKAVKAGLFTGFSMGGRGQRIAVDD